MKSVAIICWLCRPARRPESLVLLAPGQSSPSCASSSLVNHTARLRAARRDWLTSEPCEAHSSKLTARNSQLAGSSAKLTMIIITLTIIAHSLQPLALSAIHHNTSGPAARLAAGGGEGGEFPINLASSLFRRESETGAMGIVPAGGVDAKGKQASLPLAYRTGQLLRSS